MSGLRESEKTLLCMTVFALSCPALQMVSCQNKRGISGCLEKKTGTEVCSFKDKCFQLGVQNFSEIK